MLYFYDIDYDFNNIDYLNAENLKVLYSEFKGLYMVCDSVILLNYYESENVLLIHDSINEFRIFDFLEDRFSKDIVVAV